MQGYLNKVRVNANHLFSCFLGLLVPVGNAASPSPSPQEDGLAARAYTVKVLSRLAEPVLVSLSENRLKKRIPKLDPERDPYAPLEAFGRLLAGMAPWLELGPGDDEEGKLRARYIELAVRGLGIACDPDAPDFMNFNRDQQPLVDAAYVAFALLRAPNQLWGNLGERERQHVLAALKSSRQIEPLMNNWLLFSAIIEVALWEFTGECEMKPIEVALSKHTKWYLGDGTYGDGSVYRWDYYNSYVIHPMLLEIVKVCRKKEHPLGNEFDVFLQRAKRYAQVQERLISPEGTFPVIGRSSTYRFGAFQTLSLMALMHELPAGNDPGAVRAALTAVIRRMAEAPGTFDAAGWLRIGAVGHQPSIKESYISSGSPYVCAVGLVHLGLPPSDPFWTAKSRPWTQQRIWAGEDVPADRALKKNIGK